MYEHDEPSERFPVVDLSSGEEGASPNTSWDEEITRKFFSDPNHGFLRPPDDGNVIVLSNSDEEEQVCEDDHANAEAAPSSAGDSLTPTASTIDDNDALDGVQNDSNGSSTPDRVQGGSSDGGDEVGMP
jgi:hypothetical protein